MKRLNNIFRKWFDVYTKPKPTLKKEAKTTNMTEALWHLVVAGIISGIIGSIANYSKLAALDAAFGGKGKLALFVVVFGALLQSPAYLIMITLFSAGLTYLFGRLLGGKGKFSSVMHILALITAPLFIAMYLINELPDPLFLIFVVLYVYTAYLETIGLKEVNKYSTLRAVLTWLIPSLLLLLAILLFVPEAILSKAFS